MTEARERVQAIAGALCQFFDEASDAIILTADDDLDNYVAEMHMMMNTIFNGDPEHRQTVILIDGYMVSFLEPDPDERGEGYTYAMMAIGSEDE